MPVFTYILTALIFLSQAVFASPATLEYQGRILKSDGTPLEYGNVSFLFQITDPAGSCIIYQELRSGYSMVNSRGIFDVPIGSGTVQYPLSGGTSILDIFDNSANFYCGSCSSSGSSYTCSATTTQYAPVVSDGRLLRVSFYDGSGWKTISPDNVIRSVPYSGFAMTAQKLGTNVASDFLLKAGLPTCSAGTFLSWNGSSLSCAGVSGSSGGTVTNVVSSNAYLSIVNGATTPTLTVNVGTTANTVAAGNDTRIVNAIQTGASAGGDLSGTLPSPTVAKIQGVAVSTTAPASGNVLKYSGSNWAPTALATSDVSGLDTALSGKISASQISGSCAANQTLVFLSPTSTWTCTNISLNDSQITYASRSANQFLASPDNASGAPTFRAMTSADLPAGTLSGAGTAGYVPYYNASSTLTNSMLYYDGSNLGLNTSSPAAKVHVVDEGTGVVLFDNYSSVASTNPALIGRKAGGTKASPTAVTNAQTLMFIGARGYTGTAFSSASKASLMMSAAENWSDTAQGTKVGIFTTTNGGTTSAERVRIENNGYVGIGTTTPTSQLEVRGGLAVSNSNASVAIALKPEDPTSTYTNTADERWFQLMTTTIGTDINYKFSWRNADGSSRSDVMNFLKDGTVNFLNKVGINTNTPRVTVDMANATDALGLPTGTTAQRPTTLNIGMIRWNKDNVAAEIYNGTAWVSLGTYSGTGAYSNVSTITGSSSGLSVSAGGTNQDLTLSGTGTGVVKTGSVMTVTNSTASTGYNNGALVVSGGVGVNGNINASGNIATSGAVSGSTLYAPQIYGGTTASQNISIDSTSHATKGSILLASSGGNVGVGTATPNALLALNSTDANATGPYSIIAQTGVTNNVYVNGLANITSTTTTANSVYGSLNYVTFAPSANSSAEGSASQSEVVVPATSNVTLSNYLYGGQAKTVNLGSGNITGGMQAMYTYAANAGTGTVANLMGAAANAGNFSTGTVSNLYGLRITTNNLAGGTVTNAYGLYVGGLGAGGGTYTNTPYDIYASDSGANNYFAGKTGIGTAAPLNKLDVSGGVVIGSGYAGVKTAPTNGLAVQGPVYVNQSAAYTTNTMTTPIFQVSNVGDSNAGFNTFSNAGSGFQSRILLNRSRGSTVGDFTATQSGDGLGSIHFGGSDGAGLFTAAVISGLVDNTVATGVVPGRLTFQTVNSSGTLMERMRIDSSGNVGIGTTAPPTKLAIVPSVYTAAVDGVQFMSSDNSIHSIIQPIKVANGAMNLYLGANTYASTSGTGLPQFSNAVASAGINIRSDSGALHFITGPVGSTPTVQMVFNSSGNLGIGTSGPGYRLEVQGGDIYTGGYFRSPNGTIQTSDIRFKKNIAPIENALDKILSLRGVTYDWRQEEFPDKNFSDRHQIGVIAQEVETKFPEAVAVDKQGYKSVNYAVLVAPLINAVKELYAKMTGHDEQIANVTRRLASIEESKKTDKAEIDSLKKENAALKAYLCAKDPKAPICR
ncbi:tail fiber domain-containing protein [Bdellovibrio sp. NC01]|uniref:tail fiber domain-containing protein n=1 Tax=Bdellovibrio sp. NC01 TaxID=2220073 RepID=UPI00115A3175|nr:tail fiber domain-containing protein [Bdellovibrio sp. NC01]QDK37568.1 hypothetical protein DOE51_08210 [Bdellovibrio sp. NC01]